MLNARQFSTFALGQACPPGFAPSVSCVDGATLETDPRSGCQRCVAPTSTETSSQACIRTLQYFLAAQGSVSYAAPTGSWNPETERALEYRLGSTWKDYPGGACGIVAALQAGQLLPGGGGATGPGAFGPGYPGFSPGSGELPFGLKAWQLGLIGGGAVLLLLFALRK